MKTRYMVSVLLAWMALCIGVVQADASVYAIEADGLNGQKQSLERYRNTLLVVNFWATWCPPCVKEMPELEELNQAYPDVRFVGLAIDTQRNVKRFLEKVPVNYDIYVTGHRGVQIMKSLGNKAGGIPYTLVLTADGSVARQILGQINQAELGQILSELKN